VLQAAILNLLYKAHDLQEKSLSIGPLSWHRNFGYSKEMITETML